MTKLYLMKQLQDIPGNPEILIVRSIDGGVSNIEDISTGVCEDIGKGEVVTYSAEKKKEEPELDDCIILWI